MKDFFAFFSLTLILILIYIFWHISVLIVAVVVTVLKVTRSLSSPGPPKAETSIAQAGELQGTAVVEELEFEDSDVTQQLEAAVARAKTQETEVSGLPGEKKKIILILFI